jgi:hypothetical protein
VPVVLYPTALPPLSVGLAAMPRERAARSTLAGDPQARARWRDGITDVEAATWIYSAEEMAIWRPWFHTMLRDGQLRFSAVLAGPGGHIARVVRYRPDTVKVNPLGAGHCRVAAQLEIRGRSAAPTVT